MSRSFSAIPALEQRQLLSGSTEISMYGGQGVHSAVIPLPTGTQSFVGFTASPTSGSAYVDADNQIQYTYNASGSTTTDSLTVAYMDGLGQPNTYTVNVTITGESSETGYGSGSGAGASGSGESSYGSGYGSGSASGDGSGSGSESGSGGGGGEGSGSGGGSGSGTGSAPVAVDDVGLGYHGQVASGNVIGGIAGAGPNGESSDVFSGIPIFTILDTGLQGQAVITNPYTGEYTYTPSSDFAGDATFTYTLTDAYGSDEGEVTISFTNWVTEPQDDSIYTYHDHAVTGFLGDLNNLIPDNNGGWTEYMGDAITFVKTIDPSNGTLDWNSISGEYTYTPDVHYVGIDSFTYILSDPLALSTTWATVTITVANSVPEPHDDTLLWGLHDRILDGNVAENDGLTSDGFGGWRDTEGDSVSFEVTTPPDSGDLYLDPITGGFVYTPEAGVAGLGEYPFQYKLSDGLGTSVNAATVDLKIYNFNPFANDITFDYPEPGIFIDIDVLNLNGNSEFDYDGDTVQIQSVTQPSDGGTAAIVGNKIRYTPPAAYNTADPNIDRFAMGTWFNYTLADSLGATSNLGRIEAAPRSWAPIREYSRSNDDQNERIFETAKIKLELEIDKATGKVFLIYTATGTTNIRLRYDEDTGTIVIVQPGDEDQGLPEYQFFQAALFLQKAAKVAHVEDNPNTPQSEYVEGDDVPAGGDGVNLSYLGGPMGGGTGSTLSGRLEVGSYNTATGTSGTAVIQMQQGGKYYNLRQTIPWMVAVENVGGNLIPKTVMLHLFEEQVQGRLPNDLRIVSSSNTNGLVFKLGYPNKADELERDPTSLIDPLDPPTDWTTMVKVRNK